MANERTSGLPAMQDAHSTGTEKPQTTASKDTSVYIFWMEKKSIAGFPKVISETFGATSELTMTNTNV
jgi:hypothetical protein